MRKLTVLLLTTLLTGSLSLGIHVPSGNDIPDELDNYYRMGESAVNIQNLCADAEAIRVNLTYGSDSALCGTAFFEASMAQCEEKTFADSSSDYPGVWWVARCLRVNAYPETIETEKSFLFLSVRRSLKFCISELEVESDYGPGSIWDGTGTAMGDYTLTATSGDNLTTRVVYKRGFSLFGISIIDKEFYDCPIAEPYDKSDPDQMHVYFNFHKPEDDAQKKFLYEHSEYLICDDFRLPAEVNSYCQPVKYSIQFSAGSEKSEEFCSELNFGTYYLE